MRWRFSNSEKKTEKESSPVVTFSLVTRNTGDLAAPASQEVPTITWARYHERPSQLSTSTVLNNSLHVIKNRHKKHVRKKWVSAAETCRRTCRGVSPGGGLLTLRLQCCSGEEKGRKVRVVRVSVSGF